MFKKLNSIYKNNKIIGIICYAIAVGVAFYLIFFILGYYLTRLIWSLKIPKWAKISILALPILITIPTAFAWTGVTTGIYKTTKIENTNFTSFYSSTAKLISSASLSSTQSSENIQAVSSISSIITSSIQSTPSSKELEKIEELIKEKTKEIDKSIPENKTKIDDKINSMPEIKPIPQELIPQTIPKDEPKLKTNNNIQSEIINEGVKQHTSSKNCHTIKSPNYTTIKNYKLFNNLDECIANGGKLYQ